MRAGPLHLITPEVEQVVVHPRDDGIATDPMPRVASRYGARGAGRALDTIHMK